MTLKNAFKRLMEEVASAALTELLLARENGAIQFLHAYRNCDYIVVLVDAEQRSDNNCNGIASICRQTAPLRCQIVLTQSAGHSEAAESDAQAEATAEEVECMSHLLGSLSPRESVQGMILQHAWVVTSVDGDISSTPRLEMGFLLAQTNPEVQTGFANSVARQLGREVFLIIGGQTIQVTPQDKVAKHHQGIKPEPVSLLLEHMARLADYAAFSVAQCQEWKQGDPIPGGVILRPHYLTLLVKIAIQPSSDPNSSPVLKEGDSLMSTSATKPASTAIRFSDQVVPTKERAVQAVHRIMDPDLLDFRPGLRHAVVLEDQALVFIDSGPAHQAVIDLIDAVCSDLHVTCQIVPVTPDLCLVDQGNSVSGLVGNLPKLKARLSVSEPRLALVTDRYFLITHHDGSSLKAGSMTADATKSRPAELAISLKKAVGGLLFLINGRWLDVLSDDTIDDVIDRAPELYKPQVIPQLAGQMADFLQRMVTRLQAAGENKVTSTVPTWFSLDSQNRPLIDWPTVVAAAPIGEASRKETTPEAEQALHMAHSLADIVKRLRATASAKLTGVLPYGFNFDAQGGLLIDPEALFRGF